MSTVLDCLHAVAEGLGEYGRFLTTAAGTTSTLVVSSLVNTTLTATEFATMTALVETGPSAGQVGHIQGGGLDRSTGTLTIGDPYTTAPGSGVYFSLYRLLAPYRKGVTPGLLEILNEALRDYLWVEDTVTVAGVTGQHYYSIDTTTYPWWTDRRRVIEVRRPVTTADTVPVALNTVEWDWETVGETKRLVFPGAPFATGESAAVKVYRPANSRLKLNATVRAILTGTGVTSAVVDLGGYYTALPTIAPSSGAATFTAVMAATPGPITSVTVGAGGTYTAGFPPALTVTRNASDTGWANQSSQMAGVMGIGDELISDVGDVKAVCLWLAYRALAAQQHPLATVAEWMAKSEQWGKEAATLEHVGEPSNLRTNVAQIRPTLVGGRSVSAYSWRRY